MNPSNTNLDDRLRRLGSNLDTERIACRSRRQRTIDDEASSRSTAPANRSHHSASRPSPSGSDPRRWIAIAAALVGLIGALAWLSNRADRELVQSNPVTTNAPSSSAPSSSAPSDDVPTTQPTAEPTVDSDASVAPMTTAPSDLARASESEWRSFTIDSPADGPGIAELVTPGPTGFVAELWPGKGPGDGFGFSPDGVDWTPISADEFDGATPMRLAATEDAFYATTGGRGLAAQKYNQSEPDQPTRLYRSTNGTDWQLVSEGDWGDLALSYPGMPRPLLHRSIDVLPSGVTTEWSRDGVDWQPVVLKDGLKSVPLPWYVGDRWVSPTMLNSPQSMSFDGVEWQPFPAPPIRYGVPVSVPGGLLVVGVDADYTETTDCSSGCTPPLTTYRWDDAARTWSKVAATLPDAAPVPSSWSAPVIRVGDVLVVVVRPPDSPPQLWTSPVDSIEWTRAATPLDELPGSPDQSWVIEAAEVHANTILLQFKIQFPDDLNREVPRRMLVGTPGY